MSSRCSFGLLCRSADRELRVEVKGTTSAGEEIVLTRREVEDAALPGYTLFASSGVEFRRDASVLRAPAACAVFCARGTSNVIG